MDIKSTGFSFKGEFTFLKSMLFVDGFNFYHSISHNNLYKYKWINYHSLGEHITNHFYPQSKLVETHFFTAIATWNKNKALRHENYIKALEHFNINVVKGKFREKFPRCRNCGQTYKTYEEKETDVNIAIHLLEFAFLNKYDTALILSGDSDLVNAIDTVRKIFNKKVIIIIPPKRKANHLIKNSDNHFKIKEIHLRNNQLPNSITLSNNTVITKPQEWN